MFNFNTKKINIYGPIVMVVVFLSSALSIGPGYAFGMFIKPLQNEFAWSTTEISFALSFAFFTMDNEIIESSLANCIPFMPFEDLPLNTLNFFASNLIHLPNLVLKIIS